jgi:hypothetical protein
MFLFCSIGAGLIACKKSTNSENSTTENQINDSVRKAQEEEALWKKAEAEAEQVPLPDKVNALTDSANIAWLMLTKTDERKFKAIHELLDYTKKFKKYNKAQFDSVKLALKQTESLRYDENNVSDKNRIDDYNMALEQLMDVLFRFVEVTPDFQKYKYCGELQTTIKMYDDQDFNLRMKYNSFARDYNEILTKRKDELQKLGEKYAKLETMKTFPVGE